jgi:hypothetical protein
LFQNPGESGGWRSKPVPGPGNIFAGVPNLSVDVNNVYLDVPSLSVDVNNVYIDVPNFSFDVNSVPLDVPSLSIDVNKVPLREYIVLYSAMLLLFFGEG